MRARDSTIDPADRLGPDRGLYQVLAQQSWSPVVALNRALALAERVGIHAGRRELIALAGKRKLSRYPFYWGPLLTWKDAPAATPRHGRTASHGARPEPGPSMCHSSGGLRAWKIPSACPA